MFKTITLRPTTSVLLFKKMFIVIGPTEYNLIHNKASLRFALFVY